MHRKILRKTGLVILAAALAAAQPGSVSASVFGDAPREAGSGTETQSGEGTLSAPSGEKDDSIFGKAESGVTSGTAATDEKLQSLLSSLAFPSGNGTWAAYVCNLTAGTEGTVNDHQMQAASLIKLYIMGAVYERYDSLIQQYGQSSVDSNLQSMITVSDNDAANTLTSYLGGGDGTAGMGVVNSFCSANGYASSHMGRLLLQSNEFDDNYTSVSDCGHFLKKVYEGNKSGDAKAQAQFSLLAAQQRRNKIPAQMPSGVSVANKTGELADVENDAGIIYNTSHDVVIVFMSEGLSEVGSAQSTIASLSRQIYDYYEQNGAGVPDSTGNADAASGTGSASDTAGNGGTVTAAPETAGGASGNTGTTPIPETGEAGAGASGGEQAGPPLPQSMAENHAAA